MFNIYFRKHKFKVVRYIEKTGDYIKINKNIHDHLFTGLKNILWLFFFLIILFQSHSVKSQVKTNINQLIEKAARLPNGKEKFDLYNSIAFELRLSLPDSSIKYAQKAIQLGESIGLIHELSASYNLLGVTSMYMGAYYTSHQYLEKALRLSLEADNFIQVGHAYNNIGRLFLNVGGLDDARPNLTNALIYFDKAGDKINPAYVYISLSALYEGLKKYDSAIIMAQKSLEIRNSQHDLEGTISSISRIVSNYRKTKDYSNAIRYVLIADSIAQHIQNTVRIAEAKVNYADLLFEMDRIPEARQQMDLAKIQLSHIKNSYITSRAYLLEGKIELFNNNIEKAISAFKIISEDSVNAIGLNIKEEALTLLIETLRKTGDSKSLEKYQYALFEIKSNRKNEDLKSELDKLNMNLAMEKLTVYNRDREIEVTTLKYVLFSVCGILLAIGTVAYQYKNKLSAKKKHEAREATIKNELKISERRYRLLVESSMVYICTHDLRGYYLTINTPGARSLEYNPEELIGHNITSVLSPEAIPLFPLYLDEIVNKGYSHGFLSVLTKSGNKKVFLYNNVLIKDLEKEPFVMGSALDVTDWKKTEQAERKAKANLELLVSSLEDMVLEFDSRGLLKEPFAGKTLHQCFADNIVIQKPITEIFKFLPDQGIQLTQLYTSALNEKKTFHYEFNHLEKWFKIKISPIIESGTSTRNSLMISDITDQKHSEFAIVEAKRQAEDANRAKSEFLANMSHEIRTPMNSILGFTEILISTAQDELSKKHLNIVLSSGKTLLSLVNDLLDLSKIEAGKLSIHSHPTNILDIIEEVNYMFTPQIQNKSLNFTFSISDKLPQTIIVDEIRLRQVLINLVGNAVKFTNRGNIHIAITGNVVPEHQRCNLKIDVSDTGIGIAEEDKNVIFESFRQSNDVAKGHFGGTGLGLAITKRLVELLGGKITLKSKIGEGSVFTVTLPGVKYLEVTNNIKKTSEEHGIYQFKPAKILVIDDINNNLSLMQAFLSPYPFQLYFASCADEGITMAKENIPDLIFMDIRMPGMDGFHAAGLLKENPITSHIPIIAFTASLHFNEDPEGFSHVFNGLLPKPVQKNDLIKKLTEFIPYEYILPLPDSTPEITPLTAEQSLIHNTHLAHIHKQFNDRAKSLAQVFDIHTMDKFLLDLNVYIQGNQIQALYPYIIEFQEDYRQFNLDRIHIKMINFEKNISSLLLNKPLS